MTPDAGIARFAIEGVTDRRGLSCRIPLAGDRSFQAKWKAVKQAKKAQLAALIKSTFGDDVNLNAMFDIQVRRAEGISHSSNHAKSVRAVLCIQAAVRCT